VSELQKTNDIRQMAFSQSRQLVDWMTGQGVSLAFTSYQTGRLFLAGVDEAGRLSLMQRSFTRAMGLHAAPDRLWLADLYQLWRLDDVAAGGTASLGGERYDRLYVPRVGHTTGDIDVHDIGVRNDGSPVFVSSLYSCLATVSDTASFKALWRPPFVSKLAAEDRCHLNGLAMRGGEPAYVTACSRADAVEGWREHRAGGGVVVDVANGEVVCEGLSMPHSPRLRTTPEGEELWVLNSGTGYLGRVEDGRFEPVAFCPGFMRGLSIFGDHALVGTSMPRKMGFSGLPLDEELARRDAAARCAVLVVDLRSGDVVHWLRFDSHITELYDVAVLPGVRRPAHLGFQTNEIRQLVTVEG
jgi:uncharacterized protein (TIGR03032 family)